eukprot:365433-Chlamydomonas_euryale.AAC.3
MAALLDVGKGSVEKTGDIITKSRRYLKERSCRDDRQGGRQGGQAGNTGREDRQGEGQGGQAGGRAGKKGRGKVLDVGKSREGDKQGERKVRGTDVVGGKER